MSHVMCQAMLCGWQAIQLLPHEYPMLWKESDEQSHCHGNISLKPPHWPIQQSPANHWSSYDIVCKGMIFFRFRFVQLGVKIHMMVGFRFVPVASKYICTTTSLAPPATANCRFHSAADLPSNSWHACQHNGKEKVCEKNGLCQCCLMFIPLTKYPQFRFKNSSGKKVHSAPGTPTILDPY